MDMDDGGQGLSLDDMGHADSTRTAVPAKSAINSEWLLDRLATPFSAGALSSVLHTETVTGTDEADQRGIVALLQCWDQLPDDALGAIVKARILLALFSPPQLSDITLQCIQALVDKSFQAFGKQMTADYVDDPEAIDEDFVKLLVDGMDSYLDASKKDLKRKIPAVLRNTPPLHVIAAALLLKYNPAVVPEGYSPDQLTRVLKQLEDLVEVIAQTMEYATDAAQQPALLLSDLPLEARYMSLSECFTAGRANNIPFEHSKDRHFSVNVDTVAPIANTLQGFMTNIDKSTAAQAAAIENADEEQQRVLSAEAEAASAAALSDIVAYLAGALPVTPAYANASSVRSTVPAMSYRPKIGHMTEATARMLAKATNYKRPRLEMMRESDATPSAKRPAVADAATDKPVQPSTSSASAAADESAP